MTHYAVTLRLTVTGPDRAAGFDAVVDEFARVERRSPEVLDCAWSLSDEPTHGDVEVELTVAADDAGAAVLLARRVVGEAVEGAHLAATYRLANEEVAAVA